MDIHSTAAEAGTSASGISTATDTGSDERSREIIALAGAHLPLIAEINEQHRLAANSAKDAVQHAIRCGELLLERKKKLPHGGFSEWITTNCEFAYSTAARYMNAAKQISTGVEIPSLSAVFPSGRKPKKPNMEITKKEDSKDEPSEFRIIEGDSPLMSGAPSTARKDDPKISLKTPGHRARNISAPGITAKLIESIERHFHAYECMARDFGQVARLEGISASDAAEYAKSLKDSIKKLGRLQKRMAAIAKAPRS